MMKEVIKKLETKNPSLKIIAEYLIKHCEAEPSFKDKIMNEKKSIDECWEYIKSEASNRKVENCAVISDAEVFGLAVHYFDEENIEIKKVTCKVQTSKFSKVVETEEEPEELDETDEEEEKPIKTKKKEKIVEIEKQKAIKTVEFVDEKVKFLKANKASDSQLSLFDL